MQIRTPHFAFASVPVLLVLAGQACTTNEGDIINHHYGGAPGEPGQPGQPGQPGRPGSTGGDGNLPESYPAHRPACDTIVPLGELAIDLWGEDGHTFYFEITPTMRKADDERLCDGDGGGPVYVLGQHGEAEEVCPPAASNVRVVPNGSTECSDSGKVELDLPGQSSWKPWAEIPNFKLDVGEFQDQEFITGDKTVRMNNGQADSTIVREATALAVWRAMDYPAPRTRFVRTQSNVWDYDVEVGAFAAHNMVQPYKKPFFKDFLEEFDQDLPQVTSAWEGQGNPFGGWIDAECEWSDADDCEDDVLADIVQSVLDAPQGEGLMAATEHVIDWPMIHRNQCLSALTGTGDDWIHNNNNVVIALREDGKLMYLPYSTDISGGHPWYEFTPYDGNPAYGDDATLAARCALDPACRTLALDTCDAMIDQFEALDVVANVVQERCAALEDAGLERPADGDVCDALEKFYGERADELRDELQWLRSGGGLGGAGGDGGFTPGVGGGLIGPI